MDAPLENQWARRLAGLGLVVQCRVASMLREAFLAGTNSLSETVAEEGGDRIYAIDRHVEPLLESEIANWPDECFPLLLIAEGDRKSVV